MNGDGTTELALVTCSIPDDHIDPRRSALFIAKNR